MKLVKAQDLVSSASANKRLVAIKSLTAQELQDVIRDTAPPSRDNKWFINQSTNLLDGRPACPSGINGIIIGTTRDESALWSSV
jgi:hypothetical protein